MTRETIVKRAVERKKLENRSAVYGRRTRVSMGNYVEGELKARVEQDAEAAGIKPSNIVEEALRHFYGDVG